MKRVVAICARRNSVVKDVQDTAEQSWTVYFDLEDSGSYVSAAGFLAKQLAVLEDKPFTKLSTLLLSRSR
jgi:hypothetical protein